MTEDLTIFFREYAEQVTVNGTPKMAIVDLEYYQVDVGTTGQESVQPVITIMTADLPTPTTEATTIIARGKTYRVRNIRPDSTGVTTLDLTL